MCKLIFVRACMIACVSRAKGEKESEKEREMKIERGLQSATKSWILLPSP